MLYSTVNEGIATYANIENFDPKDFDSKDKEIENLRAEIMQLRKKKFDGVEIIVPCGSHPRGSAACPVKCKDKSPKASASKPSSVDDNRPSQHSEPSEPCPKDKGKEKDEEPVEKQKVIHPFADKPYAIPKDCNFTAKPMPPKKSEPAYQNVAPIQDSKIVEEVFDRAMKLRVIPMSHEELLALSMDYHQRTCEAITAKRVPNPNVATSRQIYEINNDTQFSDLPSAAVYLVDDPVETYINSFPLDERPNQVVIAYELIALRLIKMNISDLDDVEAILDPGCQIIAMSEGVCKTLRISYDPSVTL